LSIYISNVSLWLDELSVWESFSQRVSTIYLPDRKRPMLPPVLSDGLCSLKSGHKRVAFTLDLLIAPDGTIIEKTFLNTIICVSKNYAYEEPELLVSTIYKNLVSVTNVLSRKYPYMPEINDSHDIVAYLMILMNYHSARELLKTGNGIFRSANLNRDLPDNLPVDVSKFLRILRSSAGQYINLETVQPNQKITHDMLDLDAYVHITSPIRRLVDLLNMIKLQENLGLMSTKAASDFYQKWIHQIEFINTTMRSIRRVQTECQLLHLCRENVSAMEKIYEGYIIDRMPKDQNGFINYSVYLPELKMISRFVSQEDVADYSVDKYKLFVFDDEEKFKKKIRIQCL